MTDSIARLCEQVSAAANERRTLVIGGGHTKAFYGNALAPTAAVPERLDMCSVRGIVNYQPTELVVTARAGTPLQEVIETLAASNQVLAFEPPAFGAQATIGGCVAAGLAGPGRYAGGPIDGGRYSAEVWWRGHEKRGRLRCFALVGGLTWHVRCPDASLDQSCP